MIDRIPVRASIDDSRRRPSTIPVQATLVFPYNRLFDSRTIGYLIPVQ
ncbi:MAG: hypothetical protein LBF90_00080 [Prevotellaceae bacterium]|nr:hypothetical protein [Prevotellaceae bacterium]